jgi:hypothetical protein
VSGSNTSQFVLAESMAKAADATVMVMGMLVSRDAKSQPGSEGEGNDRDDGMHTPCAHHAYTMHTPCIHHTYTIRPYDHAAPTIKYTEYDEMYYHVLIYHALVRHTHSFTTREVWRSRSCSSISSTV